MKISNLSALNAYKEKGLKKLKPRIPRIAVGMGTCGIGNGADKVYHCFKKILKNKKIKAYLSKTGCFGFCAKEPLVNIYLPHKPLIILHSVSTKDVPEIINCVKSGNLNKISKEKILCKIEKWDHLTEQIFYGRNFPEIPAWDKTPFFKSQKKIVLRNCGLINPEDIDEYIAAGGYQALYKVVKQALPHKVIQQLKASKLRGRGGAGFPTGRKWELTKQAKADQKFIICNADEGDPGAYMNRNEIESDPHSLLEGMLIGAYAMGATEGIIYVRAEYPLAIGRLKTAIAAARNYKILGENIFNSGFCFDVNIVEGAGAFVCGEETSLIASIEGFAGRPRPRPPFPSQKGLWTKPTNINNVETWFNIPVIIARGGKWFAKTGSASSTGTKVFSLVGKIQNTGLVELPLGTSLETIIYDIGGGSSLGKKIKAVQTGGPSGGCIPREFFSTAVDYESLARLGAIMGSGGMVAMDEDNCMVDVAQYFVEFTTSESCGKCVSCREGLYQALGIIKAVTKGQGKLKDIEELERLGLAIKDSSLCGLGQTGPNPVLTTLCYFQDEYKEHIYEQRCAAGICESLFLSPCENSCPLHMNIPAFIQLFREKRTEDAFWQIIQDNPLPGVTGRICHHPCESRCRRMDIDQAVGQREIHRYISDTIYKQNKDKLIFKTLRKKRQPETGKKIAVVGAGPAGLTAAFYLRRLGHKVTIYEAQAQAGGMLQLTIPAYRLPRILLKREIKNIAGLGIKFVFNKKIGVDIPLKKLEKQHDAVFIAIGAQKELILKLPGENLKGVLSGVAFLEKGGFSKTLMQDEKIVVIGGGNVAIDAARTALRSGAKAILIYRRQENDMPADKQEIEEAKKEGVVFEFLATPCKIIDNGKGQVQAVELVRMESGGFDVSGRRIPVPTDKTFRVSCDKVILAIGERVDSQIFKKNGLAQVKNNTLKVDKFTLKSSREKIYAGGDVLTGPATVAQAMADGKKAAKIIDLRFMRKGRFEKLFKAFKFKQIAPVEPQGKSRSLPRTLLVKDRVKNFKEVACGFSKAQMENETIRCLRCDVKGA